MAEKSRDGAFLDNLRCPLCFDIFEKATILICGHTFCKECLQKCDENQEDVDHIDCPLCRHVTKLTEQRVTGLPQNISINALAEEYIRSLGGDLFHLCEEKILLLERNVQRTEEQLKEVHCGMQKLEEQIKEAHKKRVRFLEKNQRSLLEKLKTLRQKYNDKLNKLKVEDLHGIEQLRCSMEFVSKDRLKGIETNNLTEHSLACRKIEEFLEEVVNEEAAEHVRKTALMVRFQEADETHSPLGEIDEENSQSLTSDDRSSERSSEELSNQRSQILVRKIDLPVPVWGMTALSPESVIVGYGWARNGSDCVSLSGDVTKHLKEEVGKVCDITVLTDGRLAVSHGKDSLRVLNADGSPTGIIFEYNRDGRCYSRIDCDTHGNIYSVNGCNEISVFHVENEHSQRVISTGNIELRQICVAKSGALITSTCCTTPSTVTVYDADGHVGSSIVATDDKEHLYTTVDSEDGVYVARVRPGCDVINLSVYNLDGISLIENTTFKEFKLASRIHNICSWCYMIYLTPGLLAFANVKSLYFLTLS